MDTKERTILLLFLVVTFSAPVTAQESNSSHMSESQQSVSDTAVKGLLSKIQDALEKPFYELGEISSRDIVNRRLSGLDANYQLFPPQPFQVPGPPKLPKLPAPQQHLRQPSVQQVRTIQRVHSAHRETVPHMRQQRTPPRPPSIPKLPPQPNRRRR